VTIPILDTELLSTHIGATVLPGEPLARHNSWRVGGPAEFFVKARTLDVFRNAIRTARSYGIPCLVLGRGTNLLVADAGVRGLVIVEECDDYTVVERAETALLSAEAGASLPMLATTMSRKGWAGLEWAAGIPSALGSAVVNNSGAHGSCLADIFVRATLIDGGGGERTVELSEMDFAYRQSRFKGQPEPRDIILTAELLLSRAEPGLLAERLRKYNEHRRASQPPDPSAGSVFKNPAGDFAGRLIEAAGLKGTCIGGAMISTVHANFFVNTGSATATDMLALIHLAQARVFERFGVQLETEIELVGAWQEMASPLHSAANP
jgi:UDP-N-acetylmuramate dehydrogenase